MNARIKMLSRLNDIMQRRIEIAHQLAPFYQAARLLSTADEIPDYEKLENHPKFRPLWLEDKELKDEFLKLQLDLT